MENTNIECYRISSELKEYKFLTDEIRDFFKNLAYEYDSFGSIDKEVGEEISDLFEYGYVLGIYRTKIKDNNDIENIFNKGIKINYESTSDILSLENIAAFFTSKIHYFGILKTTPDYNDSTGAFILKIPNAYLEKTSEHCKPIYRKDDYDIRLLSEFIYGYVPVSPSYRIEEIINNYNYGYDYECDSSLLYEGDSIKEKIKLKLKG